MLTFVNCNCHWDPRSKAKRLIQLCGEIPVLLVDLIWNTTTATFWSFHSRTRIDGLCSCSLSLKDATYPSAHLRLLRIRIETWSRGHFSHELMVWALSFFVNIMIMLHIHPLLRIKWEVWVVATWFDLFQRTPTWLDKGYLPNHPYTLSLQKQMTNSFIRPVNPTSRVSSNISLILVGQCNAMGLNPFSFLIFSSVKHPAGPDPPYLSHAITHFVQ